ncbi:MAG: Diphthamide biosynthesis protein 4 [Bogoriella megaspora]|nr:MAG: Diphthamide biosynthesis protein 4 [Bogoriella megaspora]
MTSQEHYTILNLSPTLHTSHTLSTIKSAYRRALLLHHPDKSPSQNSPRHPTSTPTIDAISLAYRILSNPSTRSEYDRSLTLLNKPSFTLEQHAEAFRSGLETVDLDDLSYDEGEGVWTRGCRCGQGRGFVVREEELEREAQSGEVVVGCGGCSLWMRVVFEEDGDGEGVEEEKQWKEEGAGERGGEGVG